MHECGSVLDAGRSLWTPVEQIGDSMQQQFIRLEDARTVVTVSIPAADGYRLPITLEDTEPGQLADWTLTTWIEPSWWTEGQS